MGCCASIITLIFDTTRVLNKYFWRVSTGLIWLRMGTGESGSETSGYIKCGEFLD
jgi:hypothetical protein